MTSQSFGKYTVWYNSIAVSFNSSYMGQNGSLHNKHTVEPLNKGHFGDTASVLVSKVVLFSEVKNVLML